MHHEPVDLSDFDAAFKKAQDARLRGDLHDAEAIYEAMAAEDDARKSAVGHQHMATVLRNKSWKFRDEGDKQQQRQLLNEAIGRATKAYEQFIKAPDYPAASDARLIQARSLEELGDMKAAETELSEALQELEGHEPEIEDKDQYNSHVAIKLAWQAHQLREQGDTDAAIQKLTDAEAVVQVNEYFDMTKNQIGGDIYKQAGDAEKAKVYFGRALEAAQKFGEARRAREIEAELAAL